ncbi:hypothetical protein L1987_48715 [Smallanthus sonchifolius]|uniref:Uncharacterized protein n=1 Tax=Smallanthus sonchifolius TaxID=185202 RepID=A0ACB9FT80_9ASTR|nr:hypothetical protein L1987_48715 [Smallanthus sonchifolius]
MAPSCRSFIQNMRFILHRISPFNRHLHLLSVVSNAEGFNPSFANPQVYVIWLLLSFEVEYTDHSGLWSSSYCICRSS